MGYVRALRRCYPSPLPFGPLAAVLRILGGTELLTCGRLSIDASKVPPSRFQRREGSIYATPGSRDAHTGKGKDRDQAFKDKLKERVRYYPFVCVTPQHAKALLIDIRAGNEPRFSSKAGSVIPAGLVTIPHVVS